MGKLKEIFSNKKTKSIIIIAMFVIILVIVLVLVFTSINGAKSSNYSVLESKLVTAAKSYYAKNSDRLPVEVGGTTEIDASALTTAGYLKEMSKISPNGSICSGVVKVSNTNGNYNYQAYVDCGDDYKTISLSNYINDNTLIVTSGDGLYASGDDFVYRGEQPDNYITFAGRSYRIVSLNSDGTITIVADVKIKGAVKSVWDDRYNSNRDANDGINDYSLSRLKENLLTYLNGTSFSDNDRSKLMATDVCVGSISEGQAISRNVECSNVVKNQTISILPLSSYAYASLDSGCVNLTDPSCQNYNYLAKYSYNWWTLTADHENTYRAYMIQSGVKPYSSKTSTSAYIREVLVLDSNSVYVSGTGSSTTPFVIK